MNMFEEQKKSLLKQKINVHRNNAYNNGKFSLFDAKFANDIFSEDLNYEQLKFYYDIVSEWDEECNLPYNVGVSLDKLAADNTVMIHRTNLNLNTSNKGLICNEALYSIMNDGLKNCGHTNAIGGSAFSKNTPSLNLTMTPLIGIAGYINLLSSYKSNDAIIVASFPKELVDSRGEIIDDFGYDSIYDSSEIPPKVKKEFMVGVILKKSDGLDEFYTRDEIINSMDNAKSENINK